MNPKTEPAEPRQEPIIYTLTTEDRAGYTETTHHLTVAGAQAARCDVLAHELAQQARVATGRPTTRAEVRRLERDILALDEEAFRACAKTAGLTFCVMKNVLYDWPAERVWPGHRVTPTPSPA